VFARPAAGTYISRETGGILTNPRKLAIYGAGGHAREVDWLLSAFPADAYDVIGFVEDEAAPGRRINDRPVLSWAAFSTAHPDALVALAVGSPQARRKLARKCEEAGFSFATLVHPSVVKSGTVELGRGSIVCCGSILTVDVTIGAHVHINIDCTISHDVRIDEFATLAPGVHVSGNVHIGRSANIGTGTSIINGTPEHPLSIGEGAVIGAGACVTRSAEPNCLYAGVPAELKKRY
jgi:sugar O-acyltransferase (sialic acid O-acetyltransferase NeuD family)